MPRRPESHHQRPFDIEPLLLMRQRIEHVKARMRLNGVRDRAQKRERGMLEEAVQRAVEGRRQLFDRRHHDHLRHGFRQMSQAIVGRIGGRCKKTVKSGKKGEKRFDFQWVSELQRLRLLSSSGLDLELLLLPLKKSRT